MMHGQKSIKLPSGVAQRFYLFSFVCLHIVFSYVDGGYCNNAVSCCGVMTQRKNYSINLWQIYHSYVPIILYFIAYAFNKAYLNKKEPGRTFDLLEGEE
jgi:hypothetical protein